MKKWALIRDIAIFCLGMLGVIVELAVWVITGRPPDTTLLLLFAGALGIPVALHKDAE